MRGSMKKFVLGFILCLANILGFKTDCKTEKLKRSICFTKKELRVIKKIKLNGILEYESNYTIWINDEKIIYKEDLIELKNGISFYIVDISSNFIVIKIDESNGAERLSNGAERLSNGAELPSNGAERLSNQTETLSNENDEGGLYRKSIKIRLNEEMIVKYSNGKIYKISAKSKDKSDIK
jgi:hypothetical protein